MLVGSVVPMVVEQSGAYERSFDIYSRLLRERIVFLGQEVNDDIANLIAAREILDMTKRMAEIISRHTGQDVDQVLRDIDRDRFMTSEEAVEYGLVDAIMEPRAAPSR